VGDSRLSEVCHKERLKNRCNFIVIFLPTLPGTRTEASDIICIVLELIQKRRSDVWQRKKSMHFEKVDSISNIDDQLTFSLIPPQLVLANYLGTQHPFIHMIDLFPGLRM
jgi:hypothetical protein